MEALLLVTSQKITDLSPAKTKLTLGRLDLSPADGLAGKDAEAERKDHVAADEAAKVTEPVTPAPPATATATAVAPAAADGAAEDPPEDAEHDASAAEVTAATNAADAAATSSAAAAVPEKELVEAVASEKVKTPGDDEKSTVSGSASVAGRKALRKFIASFGEVMCN